MTSSKSSFRTYFFHFENIIHFGGKSLVDHVMIESRINSKNDASP